MKMNNLLKDYLVIKPIHFFLFLSISFIALTFVVQYVFVDEDLYYKSYKNTLNFDRIEILFQESKRLQWINYLLLPLIILIRSLYTSLCINIGSFISEFKLSFDRCFNIAIKSEIVFLLGLIIKIFIYAIFGVRSIQEINGNALSVLSILKIETEPWLLYALGSINLFEILYWLILAWMINFYTEKTFDTSLVFVAKTYGVGFLLWVTFIMFITLSLT